MYIFYIIWVFKMKKKMIEKTLPLEFIDSKLGTELIKESAIKKYSKSLNMKISETALFMLNDDIKTMIQKAVARATANSRKIIEGRDI